MLTKFEKKVADFIKANGLFGSADRVLLAISGGTDSTALLYAMCSLKAESVLSAEMICAHINHQLRGSEAKLDEDFAIAQADGLKLAITTRRLDVRGFADKNRLSIETAARKLRIESLVDIAKANSCNWIATAHQKNDNAETVLHRLLRGTGFRGLGGIWPMRSFADGIGFVRPLLCVGRDEVIKYLEEQNLKWREDRTNEDCKFRRNYIRHRLLPVLQQECSGSLVEQLFNLSQSARRFYNLVYGCAEKVWLGLADCDGERVVLDLEKFLTQPPAVKVELVRRSLAGIGSGERDLTQGHYERILQLARQNISGKRIELPDGFVVWREYGKLIFAQGKNALKLDEQINRSAELEIPGQTRFGRYLIEASILDAEASVIDKFKMDSCLCKNDIKKSRDGITGKSNFIEWFDLDKVNLPLVVRFREDGDRFWPLGLGGEKRVGKFLTAARVPQEVRQKLLVVADSEKIIWLWPIRMCQHAKITGETPKILQLQITDTSSDD